MYDEFSTVYSDYLANNQTSSTENTREGDCLLAGEIKCF